MSGVYIFDTEQTDRKNGEIIEAAWLALESDTDLASTTHLIPREVRTSASHVQRFKPAREITMGALAVHHILPHELDGYPPSSEFALPADCQYLIGHSIDFDWQAAGAPAHIRRIDTHAIAQWLWPDATGYSQSALIYMLLGTTERTRDLVRKAHRALDDCHLNRLLLARILALKPEVRTWLELWEYSEECRIPRVCPMKKYEGVLLEKLDTGFIEWCLNLSDLDPYYRTGLERVLRQRYPSDFSEAC